MVVPSFNLVKITKPNIKKSEISKCLKRKGQRNRSATLLIPDVRMDLFSEIGLLYDGDKSTIRAYMYHDSKTLSGTLHNNFYNLGVDKNKFQPIIAIKKFLKEYKQYKKRTDGTQYEHTNYNEVLCNFFPESLTDLVANSNTVVNKLKNFSI